MVKEYSTNIYYISAMICYQTWEEHDGQMGNVLVQVFSAWFPAKHTIHIHFVLAIF